MAARYKPLAVLEVNVHKGRFGFKPQTFEDDPLLAEGKKSIRLFKPLNLADFDIREGEAFCVQMEDWEICPWMSRDGRVVIEIRVRILAKETGSYFELVFVRQFGDGETVYEERSSAPDDIDQLREYFKSET